jgi:trehalose-6-phosphate synthase
MLVTSLRDGMNLVAKEYVCCRHQEHGALALSESTGASDELGSTFLANPHDIQGLKDAILGAVRLSPREARRRMCSLLKTSPRPRRQPQGRHLPRRPPRYRPQ